MVELQLHFLFDFEARLILLHPRLLDAEKEVLQKIAIGEMLTVLIGQKYGDALLLYV